MRSSTITRRFVIFSLLLALALCLCVVLSIEYFGRSSWERQPSVALILASAKDAPGWPREIAWGLQEACDITGYNLYIEENVSITDNNLRAYAETGVDFISVGALTHQIHSLDLSLKAIK